MKKNILILGTQGMLASNLIEYFCRKKDLYNVYSTTSNIYKHDSITHFQHYKKQKEIYGENFKAFPELISNHLNTFELNIDFTTVSKLNFTKDLSKFFNTHIKFDAVINAIGLTNREIDDNNPESCSQAFLINSLFPEAIAKICLNNDILFYHVSTDCVYNGETISYYDAHEAPNAKNMYGKTKAEGEKRILDLIRIDIEEKDYLTHNPKILRQSIIGFDYKNFSSLMSFVFKNKGKTIDGYINHLWNGITTIQLAELIEKDMENNILDYFNHLTTIDIFYRRDKYFLLNKVNKTFDLNCNIKETRDKNDVNRLLYPNYDKIPIIEIQLKELKDFFFNKD